MITVPWYRTPIDPTRSRSFGLLGLAGCWAEALQWNAVPEVAANNIAVFDCRKLRRVEQVDVLGVLSVLREFMSMSGLVRAVLTGYVSILLRIYIIITHL